MKANCVLLCAGMACVACGSNGGAADAGDGSANPDAAALVAQCQTQAQHFATLCAGIDVRPCVWNAYGELCKTGDTQLLIDSMNCLDQSTCRTFSDPNEGAACLQTLHNSSESASSKQWLVDWCNACGGTSCSTSFADAEIFPYLTDSDIAALSGCQGSACSLGPLIQACAASVPDVDLFLACTQ